MAASIDSLKITFWQNVSGSHPDSCWEWMGCRTARGYGVANSVTTGGGQAYRIAWTLLKGEIPKGMHVRHVFCSNPACCNPGHMALGTHSENMADIRDKSAAMQRRVRSTRGLPSWTPPIREEPLAVRFWRRVKGGHPDCCWEWQGYLDRVGYGLVYLGRGEGRRYGKTHRVAWELLRGPISDGLHIRHAVCNNPACCNPDHLALGTHAENMADMAAAGRSRSGDAHWSRLDPERFAKAMEKRNLRRGEQHPHTRLTHAQVHEMRRRRLEGKESLKSLAEAFGVCQSTVSNICRGTTWGTPNITIKKAAELTVKAARGDLRP